MTYRAAAALAFARITTMGGHQSKQKVAVSTDLAAKVVQTTAQNCINVSTGANTIAIDGNYNVISGVNQSIALSVNSDCSTFADQQSSFNADLENSMSQVLKDQSVALTQWMDGSKSTQSDEITQSVKTNFTQHNVQQCVNRLNSVNLLSVSGTGNVIKDITQEATLNVLSQCIQQGDQTSDVVSAITNTVNQQATSVSKNPFAFITDAISAVFKSLVVGGVVIFIVFICFIFLFIILGKGKALTDTVGDMRQSLTGDPDAADADADTGTAADGN
jgi:hypothetical protein